MHTYIHTYIHAYLPTYLSTYLPTYLHTYIHTYIHTHMCMHIYIYIYIHKHKYIHIYVCICVYIYIYIYICIHIKHSRAVGRADPPGLPHLWSGKALARLYALVSSRTDSIDAAWYSVGSMQWAPTSKTAKHPATRGTRALLETSGSASPRTPESQHTLQGNGPGTSGKHPDNHSRAAY